MNYNTIYIHVLSLCILIIIGFAGPVLAKNAHAQEIPSVEALVLPSTIKVTDELASSSSSLLKEDPAPTRESNQNIPILLTNVSVHFPHLNQRDFAQTALKPGDSFSITVHAIGGTTSAMIVDLHELGLPAETSMTGDSGSFTTAALTVPEELNNGTHPFTIYSTDSLGNRTSVQGSVRIDTTAPRGSLVATFTKAPDLSGTWTAHLYGDFDGTGSTAHILNEQTYGVDALGNKHIGGYTSLADSLLSATSPFTTQVPATGPSLEWEMMGYTITVVDDAGNSVDIDSAPFPIIRSNKALIDHAVRGTNVEPSNYVPNGIPDGVGIPYSLINGLATGSYYATVFFSGSIGCPTSNYQVNAFRPGTIWGADVEGSNQEYSNAFSTAGGGCMQQFHIDSRKGDGWLWGALSNTGSVAAIADKNNVPAFAICERKSVCDHITVHDAPATAPELPGISNVLFLPGIKGSNLYRPGTHCISSDSICDSPLWLPKTDLSVPQLYLNEDGTSKYNDIYVKEDDLLTQAYGYRFTASFVDDMNEAKEQGIYGQGWDWKPAVYDWRLSLTDIVHNGVNRDGRIYYEEATTTPYIEDTLRNLAARSPTGRATIIAYSNGGLVAKALMQNLGDAQVRSLIDKVIFVDVPQSGAPRAVGALLFGDKEGIPGTGMVPNVIMSTPHARTFALNSPMAYELLPSAVYMRDTPDPEHPILTFTGTHLWNAEQQAYGKTITSANELNSFLSAQSGDRAMPPESDTHSPNVLPLLQVHAAQIAHTALDSWSPPEGIHVYQINGWGADTISGYELYEQPTSLLGVPTGTYKRAYRPEFVEDGDGTVTIPSGLLVPADNSVSRYWENLIKADKNGTYYTHGTILEVPQLRAFLQNLILENDEIPETIETTEPDAHAPAKRLRFFLHGTGDLTLYESRGSGTIQPTTGSLVPAKQVSSGQVGEVQYLTAPAGIPYVLSVAATDTGVLSLDIQEAVGNQVTATTTLADIPVQSGTIASLTITNGILDASALDIDSDNDGTIDASMLPSIGNIVFPAQNIPVDIPIEPEASTTSAEASSTYSSVPYLPTTTVISSSRGAHDVRSSVHATTVMRSPIENTHVATTTFLAQESVVLHSTPSISRPVPLDTMSTTQSVAIPVAAARGISTQKPLQESISTSSNQLAAVPESALLRLLHAILHFLRLVFWHPVPARHHLRPHQHME